MLPRVFIPHDICLSSQLQWEIDPFFLTPNRLADSWSPCISLPRADINGCATTPDVVTLFLLKVHHVNRRASVQVTHLCLFSLRQDPPICQMPFPVVCPVSGVPFSTGWTRTDIGQQCLYIFRAKIIPVLTLPVWLLTPWGLSHRKDHRDFPGTPRLATLPLLHFSQIKKQPNPGTYLHPFCHSLVPSLVQWPT